MSQLVTSKKSFELEWRRYKPDREWPACLSVWQDSAAFSTALDPRHRSGPSEKFPLCSPALLNPLKWSSLTGRDSESVSVPKSWWVSGRLASQLHIRSRLLAVSSSSSELTSSGWATQLMSKPQEHVVVLAGDPLPDQWSNFLPELPIHHALFRRGADRQEYWKSYRRLLSQT